MPELQELSLAYGLYLMGKNRHNEAGVVYVKAESWQLALEAFQSCLCWKQIFCMTARLKYSTAQNVELARNIAGEIFINGNRDIVVKVCLMKGQTWVQTCVEIS